MKKIILPLVGALLLSAGSLQAQQSDTTGTSSRTQTGKTKKQTSTQDQQRTDQSRRSKSGQNPNQQSGDMDRSRGELVIIQSSEVPASLRTTLQDQKYSGWENAIIYHNKTTGEYLISPRPYRFDSQGKEMKYDGAGQYGQSQYGNQSDRNRQGQTGTERGDQTGSGTEQQDANRQSGQSGTSGTTTTSERQQGTSGTTGTQQGTSSTSGTSGTQQGTTETQSGSDASSTQQSDRYRTEGNQSSQDQISTEGMTEVESDQYPESLRTTLRGSQYQGWERGKMYRDDATGQYVLIMDGSNSNSGTSGSGTTSTTKTTHYRFDRNGKAISSTNSGGNHNDN
jgi:hypothetical protein